MALFRRIPGTGLIEADVAPQRAAEPADVQLVGCIDSTDSPSDTPATPSQLCRYEGNAATIIAGTSSGLNGPVTVRVEPTAYDLTVYEAATGRQIGVVPLGIGENADCPWRITTVDGVPEEVYSEPSIAQYTSAAQMFTG